MTHRVFIVTEAGEQIAAQAEFLARQSGAPDRIGDWLAGLLDLIDSLEQFPKRFPKSSDFSERFGVELRRANYGNYAVYYRVDDAERIVEVISFRHTAQQLFEP